MRPLGQVFATGMSKVADLLAHDGRSWDMGKVRSIFSDGDAEDIRQIAVGVLVQKTTQPGTTPKMGTSPLDLRIT